MSSWKQQAVIDAPVAEVWNILIDPARSPDWDPDVLAVTGAPVKIEKGSTFDVTGRGPLHMKATTTFRVEELDDMHELKMKRQVSGFYVHWLLTEAQKRTFADVELGVEPLETKTGLRGRAAAVLHTKSFLRRQVEKLLDSLRGAAAREPAVRS